ncbi:MAG: hypothetical protein VBE63_08485 [Lamprobacter sp.]|uniref:hypothetical protein n=1 Tax=Lamprobacter sp. TaxID=3100796 RepID=UPI002B259568|nr:hypothetical protein [Lamprobacter sp.]MEA3639967.1 hypothetical protein [Lamprobacter sp.]
MGFSLNDVVRNARMQAVADAINSGTGPATIEIYDGVRPATKGGAITDQVLLATVLFADPCTTTPIADGALTFDAFSPATAVAGGSATWGRIKNADGMFIADIDVSEVAGGGQLVLNATSIVLNATVEVTAGSILDGNV